MVPLIPLPLQLWAKDKNVLDAPSLFETGISQKLSISIIIKYKKKQVFSTESKEHYQNLEQAEMVTYVKRIAPLLNTSLFNTEVF